VVHISIRVEIFYFVDCCLSIWTHQIIFSRVKPSTRENKGTTDMASYEVCYKRNDRWVMASSWYAMYLAEREAIRASLAHGVEFIIRQGNNGTLAAYLNGQEIELN